MTKFVLIFALTLGASTFAMAADLSIPADMCRIAITMPSYGDLMNQSLTQIFDRAAQDKQLWYKSTSDTYLHRLNQTDPNYPLKMRMLSEALVSGKLGSGRSLQLFEIYYGLKILRETDVNESTTVWLQLMTPSSTTLRDSYRRMSAADQKNLGTTSPEVVVRDFGKAIFYSRNARPDVLAKAFDYWARSEESRREFATSDPNVHNWIDADLGMLISAAIFPHKDSIPSLMMAWVQAQLPPLQEIVRRKAAGDWTSSGLSLDWVRVYRVNASVIQYLISTGDYEMSHQFNVIGDQLEEMAEKTGERKELDKWLPENLRQKSKQN